jgi:OOP family OmpA-OmpF porin
MNIARNRTLAGAFPALIAALMVAGCDREAPAPDPVPEPEDTALPGESESIMRPDIEEVPIVEPAPEPLRLTIGFPDGGADLDDAAIERLTALLQEDQLAAQTWPIILRGHTDSAGYDEANLRASETRAQAVAQWLVDKGVDEDRITIIPIGEGRPVKPNVNLDGTPNEAGRAANRRVDIAILPPAEPEDTTEAAEAEKAGGATTKAGAAASGANES